MSWLLRCTVIVILLWLLIAPSAGQTQQQDSTPPVAIGGFVDSYFSWNAARPASRQNRFRNFDLTADEFELSQAQVDVARQPAPIGFHIALNTGTASDIIHAGSNSTMNLLMQGYVSLVVPVGAGLTVDAGKFVTHMGYETISAKDNFNYSRSFLFAWGIPYYHLGLRAAYPLSEKLSVGACVCNGWNAATTSEGKTFGGTLTYTPFAAFSLTADWIGGPGLYDSTHSAFRQVMELVPTAQITEALTAAADLLYGIEQAPEHPMAWKGVALYLRYVLTTSSAISARGELYGDPNGYTTGYIQTLGEFTLTYEYKILRNLLMRLEYRHDRSTLGVFDGSGGDATQSQQNTLAVSGIVTF